jgi:molybdopterin/thiamine biosynthesis adenylyltransferase
MAMKVFLYGITGVHIYITQLGIEIAKNLILAGPKQVSLYDPVFVTLSDAGRNFYVK